MSRWVVATVDGFLGWEASKQEAIANHNLDWYVARRLGPGYYEYKEPTLGLYRPRRCVFVMTLSVAQKEGFPIAERPAGKA